MPVNLTNATVEGKAEVGRAFDALAEKAVDATSVGQQLAEIGVDVARQTAPSRTGTLAGSISSEVGETTADLGTEVGYAPFPEFGTVHIPAVRFMRAGYDAMNERAESIASTWMEGVLSDVDRMA